MLFSLIHTEIGSSSQHKLLAFEAGRLIQSLFGYHHLTPSLMEALRSNPLFWSRVGIASLPKNKSGISQ
jgi:hypothetical protein